LLSRVIADLVFRYIYSEILNQLLPWKVDGGIRKDFVYFLQAVHDFVPKLFFRKTLVNSRQNRGTFLLDEAAEVIILLALSDGNLKFLIPR
jgi:hypothetical protein